MPIVPWSPKLVDAAPRDLEALRKEGFLQACDYSYALRGWASSGIKPEVAARRNYALEARILEQQILWELERAEQEAKASWNAHVLKSRNAEKAARAAKSAAWAQQEALRRKAAQDRAAKAKARLAERKAREDAAFLNWQEEQSWLEIFPWLKNSCFWNVRKTEDASSWGEVTTQVDLVLAAHNRAVREARAAGKAYAMDKAAARKARREANVGLGGGKCVSFKPSGKKTRKWDKGEKRALKSLLRRQRKAALDMPVKVKVTKEVTRQVPMAQTSEFRSLVSQARGLNRTLAALTAVGLETIEYSVPRLRQVMDYLAALEQYRPYAPAVRSWSKNQHKKAKPFKHGTESNKMRRAVENGRKALDATPAWLAYVPREDADDLVARYYEVEAQLIEVNAKIAALKAARTTETVTVNYYERVSKKALKKSEAVTVDMGTFGADSVPMVEVSMGKLSSAVAGTMPVAIKA